MAPRIDKLLAEFVNRESEMIQFIEMLDDPKQCAFAIWGDGGVGKTYFQRKLLHEVSSQKLSRSEVLVTNTRNTDYLAIMRKIRDDLGCEYFLPFTDLVNFFTVPQYELTVNIKGGDNIEILRGAEISGNAEVGNVTGVVVRDVMISDPRPDHAVPEEERLTRLTDEFVACLKPLNRQMKSVIFIDAAEKLSDRSERWLWDELIQQVMAEDLSNFKFVVCSRREPSLHRDWQDCASIHQLKALTLEHIKQYLEKRGIVKAVEDVAMALLVSSGGNMLDLASAVDGFLKMKDSSGE